MFSSSDITIEDYRGILPINLETILGVKNQATDAPIIKDLGIYNNQLKGLMILLEQSAYRNGGRTIWLYQTRPFLSIMAGFERL